MSKARDIRAGGAYVEMSVDDKDLRTGLDRARDSLKSLKTGLGEESLLGNFGKVLAGTGAARGQIRQAFEGAVGGTMSSKGLFNTAGLQSLQGGSAPADGQQQMVELLRQIRDRIGEKPMIA